MFLFFFFKMLKMKTMQLRRFFRDSYYYFFLCEIISWPQASGCRLFSLINLNYGGYFIKHFFSQKKKKKTKLAKMCSYFLQFITYFSPRSYRTVASYPLKRIARFGSLYRSVTEEKTSVF